MEQIVEDQPLAPFEPRRAFPINLTPIVTGVDGDGAVELPAPVKPKIGYLVGSDLNEHIVHDPKQPIHNLGSTNCDGLRVTDKSDYWRLHVTKNYYRQPYRHGIDTFDTMLNLVTDADQHPRVLRNMVRLLTGFKGRVVNHPAAVLQSTREEVAKRTARLANVRVPQAVRLATSNPDIVRQTLARTGFVFPALVRVAGTHDGDFLGLADSADALVDMLRPKQEHIATEFVDYLSGDGLYRKYRMFFFGDQRIFRHMLVADHWNVHAGNGNGFMLQRPALLDEERALFADADKVLGPVVIAGLEAIRREVGLDFMGVDFGLTREGELLLFEANAAMGFFPFLDDACVAYRKTCLEPAQHAFETLIGVR